MSDPCEKSDVIENNQQMLIKQGSMIERLEEHMIESKEMSRQQTQILIDMAKTQERYAALVDKTDQNRDSLIMLDAKMERGFEEIFTRLRTVETTVCSSSGVRTDGDRKSDTRFDKVQVTIITTLCLTVINALWDIISGLVEKVQLMLASGAP